MTKSTSQTGPSNRGNSLKGIVAIYGAEKAKGVCDVHAANLAMRSAGQAEFDRLNDLAEETTYSRRRYGSQWYCWPHHNLLGAQDPWPGSRFPKAVLCVTDQTRKILEEFPLQSGNKEAFQNQVEGGTWYDVPFAYLPAWEAKAARHESTKTATHAYENSNPDVGFDNNCAKCGGKMRDSQHGATDEERAQKAGVQTP